MSSKKKEIFEVLASIDCSDKIEKKKDLSYLSWACICYILFISL